MRKKLIGVTLCGFLVTSMGVVFDSGAMGPEDAPDAVDIDSLAKLYEKVQFDHALHVGVTGCSSCHHHTAGTGPENENCARCHAKSGEASTVSCSGCHAKDPFDSAYMDAREKDPDLFHIDKPGLKGAYHLKCLGCHKEMGAPTGCTDCHHMTKAGQEFFHTGPFAPTGSPEGHHH